MGWASPQENKEDAEPMGLSLYVMIARPGKHCADLWV